jgi:hypothetical protein
MTETEDEITATVFDYVEGTLPADKKADVAKKIETDDTWKRIHDEVKETRIATDHISGIIKRRAAAPEDLGTNVEKKINQRSAGRFFGRRTFGDRVPFEALLVLAVLGLVVIAYLLWSSQTGSLKVDKRVDEPQKTEPLLPKP